MRAPLLELARILAEGLFALFADKGHLEGLGKIMVGGLVVAFGAVEPLAAWQYGISM